MGKVTGLTLDVLRGTQSTLGAADSGAQTTARGCTRGLGSDQHRRSSGAGHRQPGTEGRAASPIEPAVHQGGRGQTMQRTECKRRF